MWYADRLDIDWQPKTIETMEEIFDKVGLRGSFGIWLSKKVADKNSASPFLNKLINNIAVNDITGKNLSSAMAILMDIEDFEKE